MNTIRTYIIAEAGVNHNGSLELALELVDVAKNAGADAIKFQTFKAVNLVSRYAKKAQYQTKTTDSTENQLEMLKKLELDEEAHKRILNHCRTKGIQFLSTPFDFESLNLLTKVFDLPLIKISSGEITNAPLLLETARRQKPIILSTGMSTIDEVERALGIIAFGYCNKSERPSLQKFEEAFSSEEGQKKLKEKVTLLHCTTEYPAPYEEVNLRVMDTLSTAFGLTVGFSDHTQGIVIPIAAVARGARVIEKHFTLNNNLPGPDHKASLEPTKLKEMIDGIRQVEMAFGSPIKKPTKSELINLSVARKSLVAATDICKGEAFTELNLTVKRPGTGISPLYYWDWIGKEAQRNLEQDEVLVP